MREAAMLKWVSVTFLIFVSFCNSALAQQLYSNEQGSGETLCREIDEEKLRIDPSYARELAWDRMVFGDRVHPCGVALEPFDPGTWERTPSLRATDADGRSASFRLYVLDERFSWQFGSSSELEAAGTGPVEFRDIFTRKLFLNEFCSADSVIGIGAASHEGAEDYNRFLADRRATTIVGQLSSVGALCETNTSPPLYELNLGKHKNLSGCTSSEKCASTTSPQRRLVIVAAEKVSEGANVSEALRDILERTRVINAFSVSDYYEFIVKRHAGRL